MQKLLVAMLIGISSVTGFAQTSKAARIERIAKVVDEEKIFEPSQLSDADATVQALQGMAAEMRKAGTPESVISEFNASLEDVTRRVAQSWDPKVASRIYATGIVNALSEKEQVEAENYYLSRRGRKFFAAIAKSQAEAMQYINTKSNEALQEVTAEALVRVRQAKAKATTSNEK